MKKISNLNGEILTVLDNYKQLGELSNIIITCVGDDYDLKSIFYGKKGIICGLKKKTIQSIVIISGKIAKKKIGNKGFGYDPIFIPKNKRLTFGQMRQKLKFKNDHRAKAFKKIKKFL